MRKIKDLVQRDVSSGGPADEASGAPEYEEDDHKPAYKYGFRGDHAADEYFKPDERPVNVVEVTKRRFAFQADIEAQREQEIFTSRPV